MDVKWHWQPPWRALAPLKSILTRPLSLLQYFRYYPRRREVNKLTGVTATECRHSTILRWFFNSSCCIHQLKMKSLIFSISSSALNVGITEITWMILINTLKMSSQYPFETTTCIMSLNHIWCGIWIWNCFTLEWTCLIGAFFSMSIISIVLVFVR